MASYYDVAAATEYIRQKAAALGIDPNIAVKVARSEGLAPGVWQSNVINKRGERERSYGPFQMLIGGMGSDYQRATGKDVTDPANVYSMIDFALAQAKQGGWSPWYGAAKVGVGNWTGIHGKGTGANVATPDTSYTEGAYDPRDDTPSSGRPVGSDLPGSPDGGLHARHPPNPGVGVGGQQPNPLLGGGDDRELLAAILGKQRDSSSFSDQAKDIFKGFGGKAPSMGQAPQMAQAGLKQSPLQAVVDPQQAEAKRMLLAQAMQRMFPQMQGGMG